MPMPSRPVAPLVFEARIDTKGIARDVRVVRSSGDPDWDRRVVAACRRRRYAPATILGHAIEVIATIVVRVDFR
jgi:TonB family protein